MATNVNKLSTKTLSNYAVDGANEYLYSTNISTT